MRRFIRNVLSGQERQAMQFGPNLQKLVGRLRPKPRQPEHGSVVNRKNLPVCICANEISPY